MSDENEFEDDDFDRHEDADGDAYEVDPPETIDYEALSVDELFEIALIDFERDAAWNAIPELHRRANDEIFRRASSLCFSDRAAEREVGVDVLAQLGWPVRIYADQIGAILPEMLRTETDVDVLCSIFYAYGHNEFPETVEVALDYASHPDADVRRAVVSALSCRDDARAIDRLIEMTADFDADIRNWATFGIGTQSAADGVELRDALAARLDDPDDETRSEAFRGLARRKDPRAIAALHEELRSRPTNAVVEAAGLTEAREFAAVLIGLRGTETIWEGYLESAIMACSGRTFQWN